MALDRAVEAYTPYLSAVVWNAMGASASAEDVEEVVSDAFLALWSSRERLDPERGIKAWLAAVARNKAVDRLRAAPAASLPLDEAGEQSGGALEDELERRMFAQALWRAVEDLHIPHNPAVREWVTVSIGGMTYCPRGGDSYDTYLKIADTMLYDAKRYGRNKVVWANEKMEQWRER